MELRDSLRDSDGYPTEILIAALRDWSDYKDLRGWLELARAGWHWPDFFTESTDELDEDTGLGLTRYYVSTGGWSGNEDIIGAMRTNFICWAETWVQHRRGGHYIFEVPCAR